MSYSWFFVICCNNNGSVSIPYAPQLPDSSFLFRSHHANDLKVAYYECFCDERQRLGGRCVRLHIHAGFSAKRTRYFHGMWTGELLSPSPEFRSAPDSPRPDFTRQDKSPRVSHGPFIRPQVTGGEGMTTSESAAASVLPHDLH